MSNSNSDSVEDMEATYFAMCLLMPEAMVRDEVRSMGGIDLAADDDLKVLANKFGVSMCLMAVRLAQIKWGAKVHVRV